MRMWGIAVPRCAGIGALAFMFALLCATPGHADVANSGCWWSGPYASPTQNFTAPYGRDYVKACIRGDAIAAAICYYASFNGTLDHCTVDTRYPGTEYGCYGSVGPSWSHMLDASDPNCTLCVTGRDLAGNCLDGKIKDEGGRHTADTDMKVCNRSPEQVRAAAEQPSSDPATNFAMCGVNAHLMAVSLSLTDTPIGYQPARGPGSFVRLSYVQRDARDAASMNYFNVGPKWTLSVLSFITDDPANPGQSLQRQVPNGGVVKAVEGTYNSTTGALPAEEKSLGVLVRIPATGAATSYELRFPDGTKHVFAKFDGATTLPRKVFLTQIVDPAGNALTLNYDAQLRLTSMTDATGRSTIFSYTNANPLLVTQVTDPFGRSATLSYDGTGRLTSITDVIGITSSFTYDPVDAGFITSMSTPYGTHSFKTGSTATTTNQRTRWLEIKNPQGATKRIEYQTTRPGAAFTPTPWPSAIGWGRDYQFSNTFVWDELQYAQGITTDGSGNVTAEDYTKASYTHWLGLNSLNEISGTPGGSQNPLENVVAFNYPGQPDYKTIGTSNLPIGSGQVMESGSSYYDQATYNAYGQPLTSVDSLGRRLQYTYATNGIDLLTVQRNTAAGYITLASYGNYNAAHQPGQYTDVTGKVWNYAYNSAGQLIYATDPLNETSFREYDSYGRLTRQTMPVNVVFAAVVYGTTNSSAPTAVSYTYDSYDRVRTRTNSEGYVLTYDYDALDRVTRITYPDATHDDYDYNFPSTGNLQLLVPNAVAGQPSLSLWKVTDRLGRVTSYTYDSLRRQTSVSETVTVGGVPVTRTTSTSYYPTGAIKELTDANGNVTHWEVDLQSRPISKTYAYGTPNAKTESYVYGKDGLLKSVTDAMGQVKTIAYNADRTLKSVTYTGVVNATGNVSYTYDGYWPWLTSMTDGVGKTSYTYVPPGTACSPPATLTNCGALQLASVDSNAFSNDTITYTYDALGRLNTQTVGGDSESFGYDLAGRTATHGTALGSFAYGYLGNSSLPASRAVTNGGVTVSTGWNYDTNLNDLRLTGIVNSGVTRSYTLSHMQPGGLGQIDPYNIQSVTDTAMIGHAWTSQTHDYSYDASDRLLTAAQTAPGNYSFGYDKLDNPLTVTDPQNGTVTATANALNQLATRGSQSYTYDNNGNTLSGDGLRTYKWDAENRLIEIDYAGTSNKSTFAYDGLNHRVKQVDTTGGVATETRYLWCGERICQVRNGSDAMQARVFPEGEYWLAGTKKYVYMPDHLGSVRDVLDATTGSSVAALDYGPYGTKTRASGSFVPLYQYAGLQYHPRSGLFLAVNRAYDTVTAKWLNVDPIRENGGINLYDYVKANPLKYVDPNGKDAGAAIIARGGISLLPEAGAGALGSVACADGPLSPGCILVGGAIVVGGICLAASAASTPADNSAARQRDYAYAKNFCDTPPEPSDNECTNISRGIDRAEKCADLYTRWDNLYSPGRHSEKIQGWLNRIGNLKDQAKQRCR